MEETKQLKDEYHSYRSIRIVGFILMFFALSIVINIGSRAGFND